MNVKIKYTYKIGDQLITRIYSSDEVKQGIARPDEGEKIVKWEVINEKG